MAYSFFTCQFIIVSQAITARTKFATMILFPWSILQLLVDGDAPALSPLGDGNGNGMGNIWYTCNFSASAVAGR